MLLGVCGGVWNESASAGLEAAPRAAAVPPALPVSQRNIWVSVRNQILKNLLKLLFFPHTVTLNQLYGCGCMVISGKPNHSSLVLQNLKKCVVNLGVSDIPSNF